MCFDALYLVLGSLPKNHQAVQDNLKLKLVIVFLTFVVESMPAQSVESSSFLKSAVPASFFQLLR